jgi:hypothetical protein
MDAEAKNCWEFRNCSKSVRKNCPVFKSDIGDRCWIANTFKPVCINSGEISTCFDCEWYKKNNRY